MSISLQTLDLKNDDLKCLYEWRQDAQTRAFSFNSKKQPWEEFSKTIKSKYYSVKNLPPQWILKENEKVGVLYFEEWPKPKTAQISIYLNPSLKGLKIGSQALIISLESLFKAEIEEVVAFIKEENIGALKAFKKAGFEGVGPVEFSRENVSHKALKLRCLNSSSNEGVFVIAEAGSNFHIGSFEEDLVRAKTLILEAYKAGAAAVKFQLYDSCAVYVSNAGSPDYLGQDINAIFDEFALAESLVPHLYSYANYLGIEFMCSAFSERHFKCVDPFVVRHKIASYELRHLRLLELAAQSKKPLFLSTGASTEEDIEWALNHFRKAGGREVTLLHCCAQYPADPSGLHLNCIQTLQKRFKVPIGYSDHSAHPLYAPLIAVALGASVIEKHFTLSRHLPGPDHAFAIECHELKEMVEAIKEGKKMLGLAKKEIFPQEEELANFARRGLQATQTIQKGEAFQEGINVSILRPGTQRLGLHPKHLEQLEGSLANKRVEKGTGIDYGDVLWK